MKASILAAMVSARAVMDAYTPVDLRLGGDSVAGLSAWRAHEIATLPAVPQPVDRRIIEIEGRSNGISAMITPDAIASLRLINTFVGMLPRPRARA
jgi:hypothetical protein